MKLGRKGRLVTLISVTDQQFERAVSEYYSEVFRFALSLTRNETAASDLTQEAYGRLASHGPKIKDPARLKSWLMTTCYREFLRERRHQVRFPHVEVSLVQDDLPDVTPEFLIQMDANAVMTALQGVDEVFRIPLTLFYLQTQSYKEIALLLDVPIGTVMSRLARGKAQLRRLLGAEGALEAQRGVTPANAATVTQRPYE